MYILFDIGKTKMRIARYDGGDEFYKPVILDTPLGFNEMIKLFSSEIKKITKKEKIKSVVGGIGAPLNKEKTATLSVRWAGLPLKEKLEKAVDASVFLENDSAMVALGESHYGAGIDIDIMAYVTISTGVGGARVVGGILDKAYLGFEPGKLVIDSDSSLCEECEGSTFEDYVSGSSVEKRFNKKPYEILENKLWEEELPKYLAYGLNNITVLWSPNAIVLGGSMIVGNPAISIKKTEEYLKNILAVYPKIPQIKKAKLGAVGGLYGAMEYIKQNNL